MSGGMRWLAGALLLLFSVPRLNVSIGSIPLYVIDFCIVVAFCHAYQKSPEVGGGPIRFIWPAVAILPFAGLSEISTGLAHGTFLEAIYMFMRICLPVALFFSAVRLIHDERSLRLVLQVTTVGLLVSSALIILTSLPITRTGATSLIAHGFLSPAATDYGSFEAGVSRGVRGISLIGHNILTGAFINVAWPLSVLLLRMDGVAKFWRWCARMAVVLTPFAILMTYSRGAILGMILGICGILLFGSSRLRRIISAATMVCIVTISVVGWSSDLFFFERIVNRTQAMLANPHLDERETERLYAYTEPLGYVLENPQALFLGTGNALSRMRQRDYDLDIGRWNGNPADHAVFASAVYTYGLFAALCYVVLMLGSLAYLFLWTRFLHAIKSPGPARMLAEVGLASLLGMFSWFLLGHAAVTQPRGAYLFFFALSLVTIVRNVYLSAYYVEPGTLET